MSLALHFTIACSYCAEVFGAASAYALVSTAGDANPPTPIVQEFNCLKRYFQQRLDHFSNSDNRRFKQLYWVRYVADL
jgi:hypothetical protein